MAFPNFFGKQYESASNFLDDLEMAFLVSGRDEEEVKLRAFPLVLKDSAKNWFQNLEPGRKTNWETLKETFLSKYGGLDNPEHLWHRISSLHQATSRTYLTYEAQFLRLWAEWEASLAEGERAPNFLKKEKFLAGLFPDLQEKVKGKFPETFEEALQIARVKDRKLEYQAHTSRVEHPQGPTMADERLPPAPTTTPEDPHLELLQRVTNQLDNLSINMVQGVRQQQPQPNNERMPNGPRRQPQRRDYFCYNCGEEGHGMYFCPHPRNFNAQAGRGRQQVTPPRARPPPQIQPQILQNPQMVAQPQVAEIPPLPNNNDFVDHVSSVSTSEISEARDDLEDEILSADLGQGLVLEIDETLGFEENNLQIVPYDIKNNWDAIWKDINNEFEQELSKSMQLKDLSNHMFYVWEGNHKTMAWMEAIQEKFSNSKEKHCRVLCTVIDPTKVSNIALLNSLQRMNFMNTHSLVVTHIRDEIINATYICAANHEVYLKGLSKKRSKIDCYYSEVQITKEFHIRKEKIKKTLSEEEQKKEEEKSYRDRVQKYCDCMEKILNIIDPSLGTNWLAKVLGLKWGADGWDTLEKITMIATHDAPIQSGASNLGKESVVDSNDDDSLMPDIATSGTLLSRKSYTFVFYQKLLCFELHFHVTHDALLLRRITLE
ncbi:hypothetical protein L7F22_056680 [Adiantum nelumboides]|nr:hypothetical protein [Adiantum nelumboides]